MTARLVFTLRSPTLDADMDAARSAGTLVNAWRLDDGRDVLGTAGEVSVDDGVTVQRGTWREDESARDAVERLTRGESQ